MSRFRPRRPSPALIVATIALVMATGGVGYAAGVSDSKSDNKIANKAAKTYFNGHIAGASVAHASAAATAANATNLGGSPASAFALASNIFTGAFTNDGTTATQLRGSSGLTVRSGGTGVVIVTFPRDITSCIYLASTDNANAFLSVARKRPTFPNEVEIFSFDHTPAAVNTSVDLAVLC